MTTSTSYLEKHLGNFLRKSLKANKQSGHVPPSIKEIEELLE